MRISEKFLSFLVSILLAASCTWPLLSTLGRVLPGDGGDASLFVWNLWWFKYSLIDLHTTPFYSDYIFYPLGIWLYGHTFTPIYGFISIPLQLVSSPIVAYNVFFLLSFALTTWCTFLLCRAVGLSPLASAVGALAFTFSPVRMIRTLGHLNLQSTFWLPLMLLALFKLSEHRIQVKGAIWTGALLAAAFYTSFQITLLMLVLLFFWVLTWVENALHNPLLPSYHFFSWFNLFNLKLNHAFWKHLIIIGVVFLIIVSPYLTALGTYLHWHPDIFSEKSVVETFPIDVADYFRGLPWSFFTRLESASGLSLAEGEPVIEKVLSCGWSTLLLACIGLLLKPRFTTPRHAVLNSVLWTVTFSCFVLSLGSFLTVFGKATEIPLPYAFIREVPLLNGIRVPGRFGLMVAFCLSILAAMSVERLRQFGPRLRGYVSSVCIIFIFLEGIGYPFPIQTLNAERPGFSKIGKQGLKKRRSGHPASDRKGTTADTQKSKQIIPPTKIIPSRKIPPKARFNASSNENSGVLMLPFGIENGLRAVGLQVSRTYQRLQIRRPMKLVGGMVARCPDEILSWFSDNPFIRRVLEIQTDRRYSMQSFTPDELKSIAYEFFRLSNIGSVELHFEPVGWVRLTERQKRRLTAFLRRMLPPHKEQGIGSRRVFHLKPLAPSTNISFVHHPENDIYILNHRLLGSTWKYIDREFLTCYDQLQLLIRIDHPKVTHQLTFNYRSIVSSDTVQGHYEVFVQGQRIGMLPVSTKWGEKTLSIPAEILKKARVYHIRLRYKRPVSQREDKEHTFSFPASIGMISTGMNAKNSVSTGIFFNGRDYSPDKRGFNVLLLSNNGKKVLLSRNFDTCASTAASDHLADIIENLPEGIIVAAVVKDDASSGYTKRLEKAFRAIGASQGLRKRFRYAYAIAGVKGWPPGRAYEAMDPEQVSLMAGDGGIELKSVSITP